MALRDYEELDEDDFYGQGFEQEGVVSIWIGEVAVPAKPDPKLDVLQDWCGVGYYSLDHQEVDIKKKRTPVRDLVAGLSYSSSFVKAVERAAKGESGFWVVAQYDFAYDPAKVKRSIASDPRFLGVFEYVDDDEDDEEEDDDGDYGDE